MMVGGLMMTRGSGQARVERRTKETEIFVQLSIEGEGNAIIDTGIGFFDHMLDAFTRHGMFDLKISCRGDRHVDDHHSVEDIGICLGKAFAQAVGSGEGIIRFGNSFIPMDEALVQVVVDYSGRPFLNQNLQFIHPFAGSFDCTLIKEFLRAFVIHAGVTLHIRQLSGENSHHIVEALFKALAYALKEATTKNDGISGAISTKGSLDLD